MKMLLIPLVLVATGASALASETLPRGAQVFQHYCAYCHDRNQLHPGTQNLAAEHGEDKGALLDRDNLNREYVRAITRKGLGAMPGFRSAEIDEGDLKALAEYLASGPHK